MLRVLQHYFPVRTVLLVLLETLIFGGILVAGMTQHLWGIAADPNNLSGVEAAVVDRITPLSLNPSMALRHCMLAALLVTLFGQLCLGLNRLYEFQVSASRYERASRFVESTGAGVVISLILVGLARLMGPGRILSFPGLTMPQTLQHLAVTLAAAYGALYILRFAFHWFVRRADLDVRVIILGSRGPAHALANQIFEHPEAGFTVIGLVPEPESTIGRRRLDSPPDLIVASEEAASERTNRLVLQGVDILGREIENQGTAIGQRASQERAQGEESLLELVGKLNIEMIVIALEDRRMTLPIKDLLEAKLAGVDVAEREEIYEQVTGRIAVAAMRPSYLIFNEGFRRHPWAALTKRMVDVGVSVVMLLILWPVMIATAIGVRLSSPGPVLFTQERIGQDGRPFVLMKFRSMRADAEKLSGPVWASEDDPRITKLGKIMRKTRLDELPQLFNVLSGSMSLVGPRPERQHFVDQLAAKIPYFQLRHIVKPGVTGWAQISYPYGNTEEDALHKLQYDLFYIKNYSVLFDLSILISTIKTVVLRRGT